MKHGFKAVTVDDIAREAGISKKTLYEQFENKDAIIYEVLSALDKDMFLQESALAKSSENAIHEIISVMNIVERMLSTMNVNCVPDLQRYYPQAFVRFMKHMDSHKTVMVANIKRGIKEGLYRKDFNIDLAVNLRLTQILHTMQSPNLVPNISLVTVQLESTKFFLYSISTVEGHKLIEKYITQLKKVR